MSRLQSPTKRVEALRKQLQPRTRIIDCTGAKDELLAMLEQQMLTDGITKAEMHAPVLWTPEQEQFAREFDAFLDESVKHIQETCNVRLVSYE